MVPSCWVFSAQCEAHTLRKGRYNVVLISSSFVDSMTVFPMFFAPENKQVRCICMVLPVAACHKPEAALC